VRKDLILADVAEVFGHRQGGQCHTESATRRVAHLAKDQDGVGDDAGLLHLVPEVVALAGPFTDTREDRDPRMLLIEVQMNSWSSTALPTPAPPIRPALPPRGSGAAGR
jgi:hypothetical protein